MLGSGNVGNLQWTKSALYPASALRAIFPWQNSWELILGCMEWEPCLRARYSEEKRARRHRLPPVCRFRCRVYIRPTYPFVNFPPLVMFVICNKKNVDQIEMVIYDTSAYRVIFPWQNSWELILECMENKLCLRARYSEEKRARGHRLPSVWGFRCKA